MTAFPLLTPRVEHLGDGVLANGPAQRRSDAAWNIWLSLTLIAILLLLALPQSLLLKQALLSPIQSMLATLQEECPHILDSIHLPEVSSLMFSGIAPVTKPSDFSEEKDIAAGLIAFYVAADMSEHMT